MNKYMNCTNCGSSASTTNKKTCISTKKYGKVCGGKIIWVMGLLVISKPAQISETGRYTNAVFQGLWRVKGKTYSHR